MAKHRGRPGWGWRRIIVIPVVVFCLWRLVALEGAADTRVNDTIAWGYIMLVAVLVLGYSGFATAQDIAAIYATRSGTPYAPPYGPPAPEEPEPGEVPLTPILPTGEAR